MKSWQSHDEIQASLDEILGKLPRMKSNPPLNHLPQGRFHRESDFIHTMWIYSATADLVAMLRTAKSQFNGNTP